jgi:hypothetical protein
LGSFLLANNWLIRLKHLSKKTLFSFPILFSSLKDVQKTPNFIHYKPMGPDLQNLLMGTFPIKTSFASLTPNDIFSLILF